MPSSSDVRLIGVTRRFGRTAAVEAIDVMIPGGTYCCLPGPSGCGKTTPPRMIAGQEFPTGGEIAVDLTGTAPQAPDRPVSMPFEGSVDVAVWLTVRSVLLSGSARPAAATAIPCGAAPTLVRGGEERRRLEMSAASGIRTHGRVTAPLPGRRDQCPAM